MHFLSENYRSFGQFEVMASRHGAPTARHLPSGILLHSRIDPAAEASDVAAAALKSESSSTVLVGGGMGYLADALVSRCGEHPIWVLEFDPAVYALGKHARPDAPYYTSPAIQVICASTLSSLNSQMGVVPRTAQVIVAPYLLRLIEHEKYPLSDLLHILRAERSSKTVYEPLLAAHAEQTKMRRSNLESIQTVQLPTDKIFVVAGAGPSLDSCMSFIKRHRESLRIIAASGAVPILQAEDIEPEWVIALEAREAILKDLSNLTPASSVVVFPSTHPAVFETGAGKYYRGGDEQEGILETRGGSSVIPALDLALQKSAGPVLVVGVDLGNQNGRYANAAQRNGAADQTEINLSPKFASMRAGLERLLMSSPSAEGRVFHILEAGIPLRGTEYVHPRDLSKLFVSYLNAQK